MAGPCVAVDREDGEAARRTLAAADALDGSREIVVEGGTVYLPVTDPGAVPEPYAGALAERELPDQEPQLMPADVLGEPVSYERIGDVAVVDEDDPGRARAVAEAIVGSDLPLRTVLNRASEVHGDHRVREWEVLAAPPDDDRPTETVHREYGHEFRLDLATVYFSPRLATDRQRVVEAVEAGDRVFDMFAGVGPFAIRAASRGAEVVACDVNEAAVEFCRENARRNGVADRVTVVHGDVREVAADWAGWADRLYMNLPHSAEEFLDTAVLLAGDAAAVHYYDIQPDGDPFGPGERAIRAAAGDYAVRITARQVVRSYAPGEVNVRIDAELTREGTAG